MNTTDILKIRLHNQRLASNFFSDPKDVVSYMGAMQSQAFDMAKWAIGTRMHIATNKSIDEALENFKVVRTHILRPTWHFVSADDIHWMLELSSPRLRPVFQSYGKMTGVDQEFVMKGCKQVEKVLENDNHLTRQEIISRLNAEGIEMNTDNVGIILGYGELEGIFCSGPVRGNKHSYCLLQKWIPKTMPIQKEEALERLARRFFTSHAPATLQDFIWWSGLLISDAKLALQMIKDDFVVEEINGRSFWLKNDTDIPTETEDCALLLPQFDEYVVSYKDRSDIIEDKHYSKVMTKNGLFSPTIMHNGEIVGSWRKVSKKDKVEVELSFFKKVSKRMERLFDQPAEAVKNFYQS